MAGSKGASKSKGRAKKFKGYHLNRPRSSKNYRLVRPEGMSDATWKAFKAVHGKKSGEGQRIFGNPPGTGVLQDAINNPRVFDPNDYTVNWKKQRDKPVMASIEHFRGDRPHREEISDWMDANPKSKKGPKAIKRDLKKDWYKVTYGPDGKAR